jgi:cytochrome c-type biogenesis protein CcmF
MYPPLALATFEQSLPEFGTLVLYAILVGAAYTFALAVRAGRQGLRLLRAARLGAYGTVVLVFLGALLLAYAFITHDFRIRYVARYSDRSMSTPFLFASLWGGQDGSLLWWLLLTSLYLASVVHWLRHRYQALAPWVIATMMVVIGFFAALMIFGANPFASTMGATPTDGTGLNPLLRSPWMIIHPPALYLGFVGCSVPFAFAVAALVTGRLDSEWIVAVRKWMLFPWLFLTVGNVLGMVWAYEELGWGGYWDWDPVENASFLPWLTAGAYLHSTMIQERRNLLKVWNLVLICTTFLLTILGTALTRSGLVSSVHSFAQSNLGPFFAIFLALVLVTCIGLIAWRWSRLRAQAHIESLLSREAMFLANNWALVAIMLLVLAGTLYPVLSEWILGEKAVLRSPWFTLWVVPFGVVVFFLMGLAPLFGWRKSSPGAMKKAFVSPVLAASVVGALHLGLGNSLGWPWYVETKARFPGFLEKPLGTLHATLPLCVVALVAFNLAVIIQEFVRGVLARRAGGERRERSEGVLLALVRLVSRSRRRYGGYVVHLGITAMFLGFVGRAWTVDHEASMVPGERFEIGRYQLVYEGSRECPGGQGCPSEDARDRRMLFCDLGVYQGSKRVGTLSPGRFIYRGWTEQPTSEVARLSSWREDLYAVVGSAEQTTGQATFQLHVNPFVGWIWIGALFCILGATVSLWPELARRPLGAWSFVRSAAPPGELGSKLT